jgi:putative tricarboxylic transport membrane protein
MPFSWRDLKPVQMRVLGDMAEAGFRQAMLLSQGSLAICWSNGLAGSIFGLAILPLLWPPWCPAKSLLRGRGLAASA